MLENADCEKRVLLKAPGLSLSLLIKKYYSNAIPISTFCCTVEPVNADICITTVLAGSRLCRVKLNFNDFKAGKLKLVK